MRTVIVVLAAWLVAALVMMALWSLFGRTLAGLRPPLAAEERLQRRLIAAQAVVVVVAVIIAGLEGALIVGLVYLVNVALAGRRELGAAMDRLMRRREHVGRNFLT